MYRILIAEDNALIRRGIISAINWTPLDCELAGEADNGRQAIELMERCVPDILLTDIKMPLLDGLHLLDYVAEHFPAVRTIVISGYDDFSFVRHALVRASVDYLLKPIRREEVNRAITKACTLLDEQKDAAASSSLRSAFLRDALHGEEADELPAYVRSLLEEAPFCIVSFQPPPGGHPLFTQMLTVGLRTGAVRSCHLLTGTVCSELVLTLGGSSHDRLLYQLRQLAEGLRQALSAPVFLGVSEPSSDLHALRLLCAHSRAALLQRLIHPTHSVFCWEASLERTEPPVDLHEAAEQFSRALLAGEPAQAIEIGSAQLYALTSAEHASACTLQAGLLQLYLEFLRHESDIRPAIQQEVIQLGPDYLLQFYTLDHLLDHLGFLCRQFSASLLTARGSTPSIVEAVRRYIETNYTAHITLPDLAELFHLSPAYLSQIFKKQYGIGLNRFLRETRLDEAKRLLSASDTKISEICTHCGFSDYVHFSKTFKEETGLSPSQYRRHFRQ